MTSGAASTDYLYGDQGELLATGPHDSDPAEDCELDAGVPDEDCTSLYTYDQAGRRTELDDTVDDDNDYTFTLDPRGQVTNVTMDAGSLDIRYNADGYIEGLDAGEGEFPVIWDNTLAVPKTIMYATLRTNYGLSLLSVEGGDFFSLDWQGSATKGPVDFVDHPTSYDPFGNPTGQGGLPFVWFGYHGELQLGTSVYLRNRTYDPTTGTFLSPDPVDGQPGTPDEANPYDYVDNDPLNKTDPLGLSPVDDDLNRDWGEDLLTLNAGFGWPGWIWEQEPSSDGLYCFAHSYWPEPVRPLGLIVASGSVYCSGGTSFVYAVAEVCIESIDTGSWFQRLKGWSKAQCSGYESVLPFTTKYLEFNGDLRDGKRSYRSRVKVIEYEMDCGCGIVTVSEARRFSVTGPVNSNIRYDE
jgi:RHS repeat-associated protein